MYTIAITGITGKSGQYLLQRLTKEHSSLQDYRFILLCRKNNLDLNTCENINVEIADVDLQNPLSIEKFFVDTQVDFLLHIAGVKFSWNILPIALQNGVDNFILVHTTGIYSKYKAAGESYRQIESKIDDLVASYRKKGRNIGLTVLRPTMIYGDLNDKNISVFIKMVDKFRIFPTVNGARYDLQPVWCKDLGNAYYDVLINWEITKNKEYILSGGTPIQLRDMFSVIAAQLGVKNIFVSCPYPIAYTGACLIYGITFKKIDMREKVQRLVEPRAYSHALATQDFGYSPANFEDGVREEIEMYKLSRR